MPFCAWCGNPVTQVSYAACPRCGNPANGAQRVAAAGGGSKTAGIIIGVIVGGLALVAVIGIIAAIAIPNLLTAMQRSRQKRSMADMRSIGVAIEAYDTDKNTLPVASSYVAELGPTLSPTYIRKLPEVDGWGTAFRYQCWPHGKCENYAIISAGADKTFEYESGEEYTPDTKTTKFDNDIVFANGAFVQYPEGVQQ